MIHIVLGTKAQLIKMVPIMLELQRREVPYNFIFTGQHQKDIYELIEEFGVHRPDLVMGQGQDIVSVPKMMNWLVQNLHQTFRNPHHYFQDDHSGIVLVHGDTASTLMGAIMGKKAGLRVGHVEAGLRSFNLLHPFPEELIRRAVGALSDILFCPSQTAVRNVSNSKKIIINTLSNTLADTLKAALTHDPGNDRIPSQPYAVASIHRYENVFNKNTMVKIIHLIMKAAEKYRVLFILHPVTRKRLRDHGLMPMLERHQAIELHPRYGYTRFISLIRECKFLMTDGGSNQEEAFYMGIPCILMRRVTERHEGLGSNVVISNLSSDTFQTFMDSVDRYRTSPMNHDRKSPAKIIVDSLMGFTSLPDAPNVLPCLPGLCSA